jgi:hypothetical protein
MTRRTRLSVHLLESRDAPTGLNAPALVFGVASGVAVKAAPNTPPVITGFRAIVGPNGQVIFTGTVSDDTPVAGYVVRITGPGVDTYAIVQRDGTFSTTTVVNAVGSVTVSATTTDGAGATSAPVYTTFTPTP